MKSIYQVLLHETFIRLELWTNCADSNSSWKEKVLVDFNLTWHHFTDCNHIWLSGLSHIPCSHSRPLTQSSKRRIMPFLHLSRFSLCIFMWPKKLDWSLLWGPGLEILCRKIGKWQNCMFFLLSTSASNGPSTNPLLNLSTKAALVFLLVAIVTWYDVCWHSLRWKELG